MDDHESIERRCDLPYAAQYAKSGRAACKGCKSTITEDSLRFSVREPSRFFDGMQDNWFHFRCFWKKLVVGKDKINERSIRGMDWLKWEDQEAIRAEITNFSTRCASAGKSNSLEAGQFSSLKLEYSRSNRGKCFACKNNFQLAQLKVGKSSSWYHIGCFFVGKNPGKAYGGTYTDMHMFDILAPADKDELRALLSVDEKPASPQNAQQPSSSTNPNDSVIIDEEPTTNTTSTNGDKKRPAEASSSSTATTAETSEAPKRRRFQMKTDAEIMKEKLMNQANIIWELRTGFTTHLKKKDMLELLSTNDQDMPNEEGKILDRLVDCATFGRSAPCPKCPTGKLVFSTSHKTYMCLGYMSEYTKCVYENKNPIRTPFMVPATLRNRIDWLRTAQFNRLSCRVYNDSDEVVLERSQNSSFKYLGARGSRTAAEAYDGEGLKHTGTSSGNARQFIKNGTVVDNEFEYAEECHVFKRGDDLYSVALGNADMASNRNSYYKIQLLKHDTKEAYYVFRSWGRVGTSVGGSKTENFLKQDKAVAAFENQFFEKTNNNWADRKYFRKKAGYMGFVETDYSEFEELKDERVLPGSLTKLPQAIKEIVMMIFDVANMKAAMRGFDLDLDRMPLGKLSKRQIMSAYQVLTELQTIMMAQKPDADKILDASNRFYTLIPHNFGMKSPDPLDNNDILKKKTGMLDALLDIQFAYNVLREDSGDKTLVAGRDPVDVHYEKLKCHMEVVDPKTAEYDTIAKYMTNTHGHTHSYYKLQLLDVIKLRREGEEQKFKANLGNRKLLWHGSGTSNYPGILSQGLRIAPPEAPTTGYMFGKGVYFADMVSKSANYCRVNGGEGLLLLCDVALGRVREEYHATNHKASKDFDSVKGVGMTIPNPSASINHMDGYQIPLGKSMIAPTLDDTPMSLQYNEYIVYNVDQIKMKYLVRAKFK